MSTIHEMLIANKLIKPARKSTTSARQRPVKKANTRHVYADGSARISEEERQRMIADNAYFRAERRNFEPGYELIDWLSAEAEVDFNLCKQAIN